MRNIYLFVATLLLLAACAMQAFADDFYSVPTERLRVSAVQAHVIALPFPRDKKSKFHFLSGGQVGSSMFDNGDVESAAFGYVGGTFQIKGIALSVAPFAGSASGQKSSTGIFASLAFLPQSEDKWTVSPQLIFDISKAEDSASGCSHVVLKDFFLFKTDVCADDAVNFDRKASIQQKEAGVQFAVTNRLNATSTLTITPAAYLAQLSMVNKFNLQSAADYDRQEHGLTLSLMVHYSKSYETRWNFFWAAGLGVTSVREVRVAQSSRDRRYLPTADLRFQF